MSADWHLRLARPDDATALPAIEDMAAELFRQRPELADIDFTQTTDEATCRRLINRGHSLVAHVEGALVGFLLGEPTGRELHIRELSVTPAFQRQGIGAGLLRACLIDARNVGFRAVTLTTFGGVPWNGPFYAALGFTEIKEPADHPRLAALLDSEARSGLLPASRCAMIRFLD